MLLMKKGGGLFFLYGYGGTQKTIIWKMTYAALRSSGEIVLIVHKHYFEEVNRTFRDILKFTNVDSMNILFWGEDFWFW